MKFIEKLKSKFSSNSNDKNLVKKLNKDQKSALDRFDKNIPLVLDLDECLLKTDFLYESLFSYVKSNPFRLFNAMSWYFNGDKIRLKKELEQIVEYDVDLYPQNDEVVELAKLEVKKGRKVHLATASNITFAKKIAKRFSFISNIHATDKKINLKAINKANELQQQYPDGFIYAGDSKADLVVWEKAKGIVSVRAKKSTIAKIKQDRTPDIIIDKQYSTFKTIRKALRVHQWAKNVLVFVPLFLSGTFTSPANWLLAIIGFFALSMLASATYVINDLWDLEDDRAHWSKRFRPLASGNLSLSFGIILAFMAFIIAFALSLFLPIMAQLLMLLYLITTLLYSFFLKKQAIVDVVTIAALFVLRVAFGAYVISVYQSSWLLVFAMALFLSLSFAKRTVEVQKLAEHKKDKASGRGYQAGDANILMMLGAASGMSSVIVMVMYIFNDAFNAQFYSAPFILWAFPFILLIWVCHIWITCARGELNDDPVIFALRDSKSLALASMLPVVFILSWASKPWFTALGI